jgi:hypothetical protein
MSNLSSPLGLLLSDLLRNQTLRKVFCPFSIPPIRAEEWLPPVLERTGETTWGFRARSVQGIEVDWHLKYFPDTCAIECHGLARHAGTEVLRGVNKISSWDVELLYAGEEGLPWIRKINGSYWSSTVFPPPDFAHHDYRLAKTTQVFPTQGTLIQQKTDGRSSSFSPLPCVVITNGPKTKSLACFLEWSGCWSLETLHEPIGYGTTREEYKVRWKTAIEGLQLDFHPGQSIPLPRILITSYTGNADGGCQSLRRHIRKHVTPKLGGEEFLPPTSFNHWFAYENNFTAEKLTPTLRASAEMGLDYFCVDGGWFPGGFRGGIGNWREGDPEKFPHGIKPFSELVRKAGMKYGTWFEPEFAHRDSEIFREHPEWFFHTTPENGRSAFHLMNFGLKEVQDWWVERFIRAYEEWGMRWVRWDCNEALVPDWEHQVPSGEVGWRQLGHINGLYQTWQSIRKQCPELVIEQCASGGMRIDLGTVRNGHTFWMNDHTTNSDLVRAFQQGLNAILPGNYANTNLCQDRDDYTEYDYFSHGCGGFGFSGRLEKMSKESRESLRQYVQRFRAHRHLLLDDYELVTGPMQDAESESTVRFFNEKESIEITFNPDGNVGCLSAQQRPAGKRSD